MVELQKINQNPVVTNQVSDLLDFPHIRDEGRVRVSTVIPTYNSAKFLPDAIQSILNQTYQDYEIIVVDDGSTDNTFDIVREFGKNIRYLRQENKGLGGARNTGIRHANGEYVGLLDADDQWYPNYLETMVSIADQHPEAAIFYCNARYTDEHGVDSPQLVGVPAISSGEIYQTLLRANFLIPSTVLMRRSVIVNKGLFDQALRSLHGCEDWDLWLRVSRDYPFVGTRENLVRYRIHGNSLSANPTKMQHAARSVIEKQFGPDDEHPQNWSADKRRAFGGVYRYHLLTSIQRQNDWKASSQYLLRALKSDPSLANDLKLFYELALGNQPIRFRVSDYQLNLIANEVLISELLRDVFCSATIPEIKALRGQVYGTAYYALGLVAYNTGQRHLSRRYLIKALRFRPDLWRDSLAVGDLIKSIFNRKFLEKIKHFVLQAHS